MLSLEGPAAEVLRDFDDTSPTALADLWKRLEHRFGEVDAAREAKRRFETRRQTDSETIVEYEQALRTLYREAWPGATTDQRDAALKRRFEDGTYLPELSQYLRLHTREMNFEQTVEKAQIYALTTDAVKPKKSVRFVSQGSAPSVTCESTSNFDLTPLMNQLKAIEGKVDKAMRDKSPARMQTPSPSPRPTQSTQDRFSQERDYRRAPSPAENDFTSKRQFGLPRRCYDETLQSFNADRRRQPRDFTPLRDRDFAPPQLAESDNYGNRTFFRSPMPTPTDNDTRRYDQRRYNGSFQPQPWGSNRGYEDVLSLIHI